MGLSPSQLTCENSRLTRVLEPEAMDTADDARDYDSMDHTEVNRRFVVDFLAACAAAAIPADAEVLDLGTGTAQIPVELCRQNPQARVLAIDIARHMLAVAGDNVRRAGLTDRIELQLVDAKGLPFADRRFRAVVSNSIMHHVPDPLAVLSEALRATANGGLLFIRDLARPVDDAETARLVKQYAGDCNAHQRQLFEDSLRAALSVGEIRAIIVELGFSPKTLCATSDRHWTWCAVKGA
jgi:ubiquinone/menaquinone biosynthesis C-methylase UbiE